MRRALKEQALSFEVKNLLSEANFAYVSETFDEAIAKLQEVIRIEPTVRSAWSTLALCLAEKGLEDKEIQARIIEATLTPRATELWLDLAHRCLNTRFEDSDERALYCLERGVRTSQMKDRSDVMDAMWDRACLLEQMGREKEAIQAYRAILKVRPHNSEVLNHLIPILIGMDRISDAVRLLESSRDFNYRHFPEPQHGDGLRFSSFRHSEVVTLFDLQLELQEPLSALHMIRQGARWLQGRAHEVWWDDVLEDDREYDRDRDYTREGATEYGRRIEMAPVYPDLDPAFRLRLGWARNKMGDWEEAQRHFELYFGFTDPVDAPNDWEYAIELYIARDQFELALNHLERMVDHEHLQIPSLYIKIGECHQQLGNLEQAAACFEAVLQSKPDEIDVKARLAWVYEDSGRREEAVALLQDVMTARGDPDAPTLDLEVPESAQQLLDMFHADEASRARESSMQTRRLDGYSKGRKETRIEEIRRIERSRAEEAERIRARLQAREPLVFHPGWWRSDVDFNANSSGTTHRPDQTRYAFDAGLSTDVRSARNEAVQEYLEQAQRLIDGFRAMSWLFPRDKSKGGHLASGARHAAAQDGSRRRGVGRSRLQKEAGLRRGPESTALFGDMASSLAEHIQDNLLDEGARQAHEADVTNASDPDHSALIETSFRGLSFDEWIELFMKCAFLLTKTGDAKKAIEMLQHCATSLICAGPFEHRKFALHLARTSCALHARDFHNAEDSVRELLYRWQFNNTPIRIQMMLGHVTGFYGLDAYIDPRLAKMVSRRMRTQSALVHGMPWLSSGPERRYVVKEKLNDGRQKGAGHLDRDELPSEDEDGIGEGDDDDEADVDEDVDHSRDDAREATGKIFRASSDNPTHAGQHLQGPAGAEPMPTKPNPVMELHYASFLLATSQYQGALAYSLRAYHRVPEDPLANLMAGVASFARMSNRQADNRHHLFVQGLTFLTAYSRLRRQTSGEDAGMRTDLGLGSLDASIPASVTAALDPESTDSSPSSRASMEATYNIARALHSVGILHMAVPLYHAVLHAHDVRRKVAGPSDGGGCGFDPYREAAYNLMLIYTYNGNGKGAKMLATKYLGVGAKS